MGGYDGPGTDDSATCEKKGDSGSWECPGADDETVNCDYVCDGYDPADCSGGGDEDADFCATWNGEDGGVSAPTREAQTPEVTIATTTSTVSTTSTAEIPIAAGRSDACEYAKDGMCDERGAYPHCMVGTDCTDCGNCKKFLALKHRQTTVTTTVKPVKGRKTTTKLTTMIRQHPTTAPACLYLDDGFCDEPTYCPYGTDSNDCAPFAVSDASLATTMTGALAPVTTTKFPATAATKSAPACIAKANNCHQCNADASECSMCKNKAFLHKGVCVATCPPNTKSAGTGNFNKRCDQAPACESKSNNCHECAADASACSVCKNSAFLHEGVCIAACPPGSKSEGKGKFNKRCKTHAPACVSKQNDCHACNDARSACAMCKNGAFLHEGQCFKICPPGTKSAGNGLFNKRCDTAAPACVSKKNHCHTCNDDKSACTMCKNAKVLSAGVCVDVCPPATQSAGKGNFGKRCE